MRSPVVLFVVVALAHCQKAKTAVSYPDALVKAGFLSSHDRMCHNDFRSRMALGKLGLPKAADMEKMSWSASIASSAQRHANKCVFQHSTSKERNGSGENIWMQTGAKDVDWNRGPCSSWGDGEMRKWPKGKLVVPITSGAGHATQMAWATSSQLGCGVKVCGQSTIVVCQYVKAGNVVGQPVYVAGTPCSKCPNKGKCEASTGLCL